MIWTYRYALAQIPAALILIAFLLGGCTLSPSADFLKALGEDKATVCVNVAYGPGSLRVARTNITSGSVTCNNDGLSVKSDAATVGVPMLVVPQLTIGQPTVTPPKPPEVSR